VIARRRRLGVAVIAVALAALTPTAVADRAAADFFVQRGEKALRERKWPEAQELFRKAMTEDDTHVPARNGLADALYGAGDRAGALEQWRKVASASDGGGPLPPPWVEGVGRAKTRVADLEAADAQFNAILDKQVDGLLDLASRWGEKDPDVAVRALRDLLKLRPGHEAATSALAALGGAAPVEWTSLFDGKDMSAFLDPDRIVWNVVNGVMVGDAAKKTYSLGARESLHGDFDLRMEARILKGYSQNRILLLCGATHGPYVGTQGGLFLGDMVIRESDGRGDGNQKYPYKEAVSNLPPSFDLATWTTYELQFRGSKVRFVVNGTRLNETDRFPNRDDGTPAILIQDVRVEVRRFQVIQR
jgi:hypothetical protein